ncbi:MAG: putative membrane protein [Natronomonas sp.]|jgi:uncharacterized membrane protein
MTDRRTFAASTVALGLVALAHAVLTWPGRVAIAFFVGGAGVAFLAEAVVIHLGWLEHHVGPKALGVPLYVLFGWTGMVYVAFRLALLAVDGWPAVALAALLATGYDAVTDPRGVAEGFWTYTDDLPGPRPAGVPWWNAVGWLCISAITAGLAVVVR